MYLKKIYVLIKGGLGNQLFQYALALTLKKKHGGDIILIRNITHINNTPRELKLNFLDSKISKINTMINLLFFYFIKLPFFIQRITEKNGFKYEKINIKKKSIFINGYWQSFKYFEHDFDLIDQSIFANIQLNENYNKFKQIIVSNVSAALHIRRGDYVTNKNANSFHGLLDLSYYELAIKTLNQKFDNLKYFIFSDDIAWCKKNFNSKNYIFIDLEFPDEVQEIKLMSMCSHFIISNSTFSWWPAFISKKENKQVVCPKKWTTKQNDYSDLIPQEWIKI